MHGDWVKERNIPFSFALASNTRKPTVTVLEIALGVFLLFAGRFLLIQGYPADPLLHACIVCASASCPDVSVTAYKPETLEADMAANMRHFLANTEKGLALDKEGGVITLSKVNKLVCTCSTGPHRHTHITGAVRSVARVLNISKGTKSRFFYRF